MIYKQKVIVRKLNIKNVIKSFHQIEFVKFLISCQPVKIVEWNGIENGLIAHLKFWLIKWHSFIVVHQDYKKTNSMLSFVDKGIKLPMGLKYWEHKHVVKLFHGNILIEDKIIFKHKYYLIGILLYPILISPIILRKVLYPLYYRVRINTKKK